MKELQDHLTEVTLKQPYMGERIPGVWLRLEQSVARFVFTLYMGERIPGVWLRLEQSVASGQVCVYTYSTWEREYLVCGSDWSSQWPGLCLHVQYMGERIPGVWLRLEQSVARFVFTRGVGERIPGVWL